MSNRIANTGGARLWQWIRVGVCVAAVLTMLGCSDDVSGPQPDIVAPKKNQLPVDPGIACRAQLTTDVVVHGSGFSPIPIDIPKHARTALPTIDLVQTETLDGAKGDESHVVYSGDPDISTNLSLLSWQGGSALTFTINQEIKLNNGKNGEIPVGIYDVVVTNPNDNSTTEPGAIAIVDKPTLTQTTPSIVCLAQGERTLGLDGTTLLEVNGQLGQIDVAGVATPFPITAVDACTGIAHRGIQAKTCFKGSLTLPRGSVADGYPSVTIKNPETTACVTEETINLRVVPPPTISRVVPAMACLAERDRQFTVEGTGFLEIDGVVPTVTAGGVTITPVPQKCQDLAAMGHTVRVCTELSITIAQNALPFGNPELVVTNPNPAGCSVSNAVALTIVPPPVVADVQPPMVCLSSGQRTVDITGTGFLTVDGVVPAVQINGHSFGGAAIVPSECTQVAVQGMTVQACTRLAVTVLAAEVQPGTWDVIVTNPEPAGCHDTKTGYLRVVGGPTIVSAEPSLVCSDGGARPITLTGTNFIQVGATLPTITLDGVAATVLSASNCAALTVRGLAVVNSCTTLDVSVPQGALKPGKPTIVVTNPTPAGCDVVDNTVLTVPPTLAITSAAPSNLCTAAASTSIGVTATGLLRVGGSDFAVTVNGTPVVPTNIIGCAPLPVTGRSDVQVCTGFAFQADPGLLPVGDIPITVANPAPSGCAAVAASVFRIVAPPTVAAVNPAKICGNEPATVMALTGTNLVTGSTVTAMSTGGVVKATTVTRVSDTQLTVEFAQGLPAGIYDIRVDNGTGCSATLSAGLTVDPTPIVFFVDPPVLYNGSAVEATIFASGLDAKAYKVELVDSAGTATNLPFSSPVRPNRILAMIPKSLAVGSYAVRVTSSLRCIGRADGAVGVTDSRTLALASIDPAYVSPTQATAVTLTLTNPLPTGNVGFEATPRVYLNPASGSGAAKALRAVTLQDAYTLSAVIPEGMTAGKYDVIVVNPSGAVGVLAQGVTVASVEPPLITSVTPSTITAANGATATIQGKNFETTGTTTVNLLCRGPANVASTATTTVGTVTTSTIPITIPTVPAAGTVCVVQLTNTSGSSYQYSAISFRNSSGNLPAWKAAVETTEPIMVERRRGVSLVAARPTNTSRFLYAIGGDAGTSGLNNSGVKGTVKSSVESVSVGMYGDLGTWSLQRNSLRAGTPTAAAPRTQAGVAAIGRFIYLVGGHNGATATDTLLRAQVLDPLAGPEITDLDAELGDTIRGLTGGRWYYSVAAVFPGTDASNPSGESLPGELLTVQLPSHPNKIIVRLTWAEVTGATRYRLYRSASANPATEAVQLLVEVTCGGATPCKYTDDGISATQATKTPLPPGSVGVWHAVTGVALETAREGLATVAIADPVTANRWYLYAFGGRDGAATPAYLSSYEWASVTVDPATGAQTVSDFVKPSQTIGSPKADLAAWVVDKTDLGFLATTGRVYVYVGAGTAAGTLADEVGYGYLPGNGGELTSIAGTTLDLESPIQKTSAAGYGAASGYLYLFGGIGNSGQPDNSAPATLISNAGTPSAPDPGLGSWSASGGGTLNVKRSYCGSAQESAFFFVGGGYVSPTEPATRSVEYTIR